MGIKYHKHKGVESNGQLKSHPIKRIHKEKKAQKYHVMALKQEASDNKYGKVPKKKSSKKKAIGKKKFFGDKQSVQKLEEKIPTDVDGYLAIDLRKLDKKGVRIIGAEKGKIWFASEGDIKGIQFDK